MRHVLLEGQGYTRLGENRVTSLDTPTHHGIDGVYFKADGNPQYIIAEAKYGTGQLRKTQKGMQMSESWIESNLEKAVGTDIADEILSGDYASILTHTGKDGTITAFLLDQFGKIKSEVK